MLTLGHLSNLSGLDWIGRLEKWQVGEVRANVSSTSSQLPSAQPSSKEMVPHNINGRYSTTCKENMQGNRHCLVLFVEYTVHCYNHLKQFAHGIKYDSVIHFTSFSNHILISSDNIISGYLFHWYRWLKQSICLPRHKI